MHTSEYAATHSADFDHSVYKGGKGKNQSPITWIYITFNNYQLPDAGKKSLSSHAPDPCCNFCRGSEEMLLKIDSLKTKISEIQCQQKCFHEIPTKI